jgi:ABC-type uncharacterized transport system permease subunit
VVKIIIEEALKTLPFITAAVILFRIAKFPDMGIGGTFLLGASVLAFTHLKALPIFVGFFLAILIGGIGGVLTGGLFIFARLNSLICGIITAFIAYSISFVLLGFQAAVGLDSITNEYFVGIFSLILCLTISLFFSTRYGLLFRIAGENPKLLRTLGREPANYLLCLIIFGNILSALSGFLMVAVTGAANLRLEVDMFFMAITSLILGEGVVGLLLLLLSVSPIKRSSGRIGKWLKDVLGNGVTALICAGAIGMFAYWSIYVICKDVLKAVEFSRLIMGLLMGIFLWLTVLLSRRKHIFLGPWKFHGEISD